MEFYYIFLELCNSVGKTPSRVALEIGSSKPAVTRWKKGSQPSDAVLLKLANYFGVTVEYLKGEQENKKSPEELKLNEGEKMLLSLFRQIPEDKQPEVLALLEVALKIQK